MFFILVALLSSSAQSEEFIQLPAVMHYESAGIQKVWKGVPRDSIPQSLLGEAKLPFPSQAYSAKYKEVFLQNDRITVCYKDCALPQPLVLEKRGGNTTEIHAVQKKENQFLKVANVYHWTNVLYDHFEKMGYSPKAKLTIQVDSEVKDENSKIDLSNNAYFSPLGSSVTYLPARSSYVARNEYKINPAPSSHDPSIVLHETTHAFMTEIFPYRFNYEVDGIHEALADYFALSILDNTGIGKMMLRGNQIRSAVSTRIKYAKDLEAHNLGEIILQGLWKVRSSVLNHGHSAIDADRLVLMAVALLNDDPFATSKSIFKNIESILNDSDEPEIRAEFKSIQDGITYTKPPLAEINLNEFAEALKKPTVSVLNETSTPGSTTESTLVDVKNVFEDAKSKQTLSLFRFHNDELDLGDDWLAIQQDLSQKTILGAYFLYETTPDSALTQSSNTNIPNKLNRIDIDSSTQNYLKLLTYGLKDRSIIEQASQGKFGSSVSSLFSLRTDLVYAGNTISKESQRVLRVNGTTYPLIKKTRILRKSGMGELTSWLGRSLDLDEVKDSMRQVRSVSYYVTKDSQALHNSIYRMSFDGVMQNIVGYEVEYGSGAISRSIITAISN